jgi:hypothetical protein
MLGKKLSEEAKRKIGGKNRGRIMSEEAKRKISIALRGNKNHLGIPQSLETIKKIRKANKKNPPCPMLGKTHSIETREKIAIANWKGDEVGYRGLHLWVEKILGRPKKCKHCGKDGLVGKKIHWANKSGLYLRNLSDWIRLCVPCHKKYDKELVPIN